MCSRCFCAICHGLFYKGIDDLMVIGGGTSGLGEGLFLSRLAKKIRIIRHSTQLTGFVLLQDKVRNHPQFEVHTNTEVRVFQDEGKVLAVVARDLRLGQGRSAVASIYIGLDLNTSFLKGHDV